MLLSGVWGYADLGTYILSPETKGGPLKVGVGVLFPVDEVFPQKSVLRVHFFMFLERPKSGIWGGFMNLDQ